MAATDSFNAAIDQLAPPQRQALSRYIGEIREQMLAARSEDARVRLLEQFLREMHDRLGGR
jgi:phage shock protein A